MRTDPINLGKERYIIWADGPLGPMSTKIVGRRQPWVLKRTP